MSAPIGFKPADLGGEPDEVDCTPGFRAITVDWKKPRRWEPGSPAPTDGAEVRPDYLYAITWDHHLALSRETIAYIGRTAAIDTRFGNHPKAVEISSRKRKTYLSIGHIDFGRFKSASEHTRRISEELEHIFIWALWPKLENKSKMYCLPAWGSNGGDPWHIKNTGHRFRGRMPREIIYPWLLVKPGRNRSLRVR